MRFRSLAPSALLAFAALLPQARAADKAAAPTVVVRLSSLDGLISDLMYLAEAAGKGNEAKQVEGILKQFDGIKGLNTTKPIGLYGRLAKPIDQSDLVLLLPVTDEKGFLTLLDTVGVKYEKKDDVYKVELPNVPFPGYFRFANGYVYGTVRDSKMLAKERLLDPAMVLTPGKGGALEITLNLEEIPTAFKEVIVGQAALRLSEAKGERKPGQSEEQYKFHIAALDELANQLKAIVNDGKALTLKLDVDRKSAEVVASARFTAKAGSKLAASIADLGQGESVLVNLSGPDSALSGRGDFALPQALRKPFDAVMEDAKKKLTEQAPDENARDLLAQIIKAVAPTVKAAELDAGFDLRGPQPDGKYTLLIGFAVKEGQDIEKALREVHKALPGEARDVVVFDADKTGSSAIHKVVLPQAVGPDLAGLVGEKPPIYFAVRKDVVFVALGDTALATLKDVLSREPKKGKLVRIEASVARLAPLDKQKETAALTAKVFGKTTDADKVRLTLDGGPALELRLSVKAKLLELAVRLDEAKKKGE